MLVVLFILCSFHSLLISIFKIGIRNHGSSHPELAPISRFSMSRIMMSASDMWCTVSNHGRVAMEPLLVGLMQPCSQYGWKKAEVLQQAVVHWHAACWHFLSGKCLHAPPIQIWLALRGSKEERQPAGSLPWQKPRQDGICSSLHFYSAHLLIRAIQLIIVW